MTCEARDPLGDRCELASGHRGCHGRRLSHGWNMWTADLRTVGRKAWPWCIHQRTVQP